MPSESYRVTVKPGSLGEAPPAFTPTQERFVSWLAAEMKLPRNAAQQRYFRSLRAIAGGHGGNDYRRFCQLSNELFLPFFSDAPAELPSAYEFYGPLHFLRMLSYAEPDPSRVKALGALCPMSSRMTILDFGCGLAQLSKAVAARLAAGGIDVRLVLADLPSVRTRFLQWDACGRDYTTKFVACRGAVPRETIPNCSLVIASEFLEHVHEPRAFLAYFHRCLAPSGLLSANINDHRAEFMHVSPSLESVRRQLETWRYEIVEPCSLYRKPLRRAGAVSRNGKGGTSRLANP